VGTKTEYKLFFRLIRESFLFAFEALRVNKLRTILSLLGITIGIFATQCDHCGASVNLDGKPFIDEKGRVVSVRQFGGINFPLGDE
jgi:hypothetical protein